ncbi:uncharacterized protein LOC113669199 [Pocillopora damicornis]|nr:uncharacterized protein LOC113669199 [Pocillopora damicornis]
MADCECQNDASEKESQIKEKKAKGPEKDLQAIFMKLRVDSGPKRLRRKTRLGVPGSLRSRNIDSIQNVRKILREPTFVYKNQQASSNVYKKQRACGFRRRRRKASLSLREKRCQEDQRESHSDSELEYNKSLLAKSLWNASKEGKVVPKSFQTREMVAVDCSRQHRRFQSANVQRAAGVNFDDTTPEELAAYFDQLLYFPKPMSAMAEMMYT